MQAREAVEMRASMEKRVAQKEKEKREEQLKELAQKAREDRAGIRQQAGKFGWNHTSKYGEDPFRRKRLFLTSQNMLRLLPVKPLKILATS